MSAIKFVKSVVLSPCEPYNNVYYINTIEIPGSFFLLKPHIFTERREVTIFIFHAVKIFLLDNIFPIYTIRLSHATS